MPPVRELLLEIVDFGVGSLPLLPGSETFDALHEHAAIPAAIKDGDVALLRQVAPEAPEVMVRELLVGG